MIPAHEGTGGVSGIAAGILIGAPVAASWQKDGSLPQGRRVHDDDPSGYLNDTSAVHDDDSAAPRRRRSPPRRRRPTTPSVTTTTTAAPTSTSSTPTSTSTSTTAPSTSTTTPTTSTTIAQTTTTEEAKKVFVCKFVGTPGDRRAAPDRPEPDLGLCQLHPRLGRPDRLVLR